MNLTHQAWFHRIAFFMVLIASTLLLAEVAHATGLLSGLSGAGGLFSNFGGGGGGVQGFCASHSNGEGDDMVLIGKIIPCMEQVVLKATLYMNAAIGAIVYPILAAILTLFIVLYGVSILRGEGELTKRGIVFLFKAAGVMAFTNGLGGYIPDVFAILSEMQEIAAGGLAAFSSGEHCPDIDQYGTTGAIISPVWRNMDCAIGKLFGFGGNAVVGSSVFGILGAAAFSGTMGVQVFFLGIFALASMVMLVIRAAYTYMITYIYLAFLCIISPFFIPLLLGTGAVFRVFDQFIKSFISAFMVPVFLFGYLVLAMTMIDTMLFNPGGAQGLEMSQTFQDLVDETNDDHMGAAARNCDVDILRDASMQERVGTTGDSSWLDNIGADIMTSFLSGAGNLCSLASYSLDLDDDQLKDLMYDFLKIAVVIYLLIVVMNIVLDIAQQTLMGAYALVNAAERTNVVEATVMGVPGQSGTGMLGGLRAGMMRDGENFAGSIGNAVSGAMEGGLAGFRRSFD